MFPSYRPGSARLTLTLTLTLTITIIITLTIVQATLGSAATERMSALYLPQYVAAMLTVTLATGMGMALV